jgi:hypothetical protein
MEGLEILSRHPNLNRPARCDQSSSVPSLGAAEVTPQPRFFAIENTCGSTCPAGMAQVTEGQDGRSDLAAGSAGQAEPYRIGP